MIFDLRTSNDVGPIEVDLCIIGAGAAGIAVAREFVGSNITVALLESGGYKFEAEVQALYEGDSIGETYFKLDKCRTRRFGGSTNCWGGMCTPLTEIDFRERSWVPYSGWPISEAEIEPYLRRAHALCGIGPYGYDEAMWETIGAEALPFNSDLLWSHFWQINNRLGNRQVRFAQKFHAELKDAANIQVYLHANVTALMLDRNGKRIEWARTKTLEGLEGRVIAKTFVLACGGIENVRLLLASNQQRPNGIGNDRDVVGRYFNEHLQSPCATVTVQPPGTRLVDYSRMWRLGKSIALPGITLSPVAQERHQTLNASLSIDAVFPEDYLWNIVKDFRDDLIGRKVTRKMLKNVVGAIRESRMLLPDVYARVMHGTRPTPAESPTSYVLFARAEQAPNPESRICLGTDVDQLGVPKVVLDWQTNELDRKAFPLLIQATKAEFHRLGLGEVKEHEWVKDEGWPDSLRGGPHHMCTTRMSNDPRVGVVDRDAKVHGLDGLYIAGSSVFPTGGHANCTLTLLATTLRLCDHLKSEFTKARSRAAYQRNSLDHSRDLVAAEIKSSTLGRFPGETIA